MNRPTISVRVFETEIDDNSKVRWLAEAGWPTGIGDAWAVFASTDACATEPEALEALRAMLHRRYRASAAALRKVERLESDRRLREIKRNVSSFFGGERK